MVAHDTNIRKGHSIMSNREAVQFVALNTKKNKVFNLAHKEKGDRGDYDKALEAGFPIWIKHASGKVSPVIKNKENLPEGFDHKAA